MIWSVSGCCADGRPRRRLPWSPVFRWPHRTRRPGRPAWARLMAQTAARFHPTARHSPSSPPMPPGRCCCGYDPLTASRQRPFPALTAPRFRSGRPDSRSLAFFTQTRLRRMPAAGGPVQTVAELSSTPRGGTWNSQGLILFATAGSAIMRVSADGGQPAPVTRPDAQNPGHQWPSFLPDGEHFLYYGSGTGETYLGSLASGSLKRLLRSDTNAIFAPPGDLLFVREGVLFAQRFDLTRFDPIGEPTPIVQNVSWNISPWNLGAFSVSDNGQVDLPADRREPQPVRVVRPIRPADRGGRTAGRLLVTCAVTRRDESGLHAPRRSNRRRHLDDGSRPTNPLALHVRRQLGDLSRVVFRTARPSRMNRPGTDCSPGMPMARDRPVICWPRRRV